MRTRLQGLGVLRASGHEHLSGCLVVPVIGEDGTLHQLYGRRIIPNGKIPPDQSRHLYLPRPLRGMWNEAALSAGPEVIVTEALIDAMTFWCAGFRNVTAAYGTNGFTEDHLAALTRHGVRRVLIAYDRDEAGDTGSAKLAEMLLGAGIECFRVLFPKGMDANAYALKVGPAGKSLGLLLQQAEWLGKGKRPGVASGLAEACPSDSGRMPSPVPPAPEWAAKEEISSARTPIQSASPDLPPLPASSFLAVPSPETGDEGSVETADGEKSSGELRVRFGERHWRVRGWRKNLGPDQMRVNLLVRRDDGDGYFVDTLDIYAARQRGAYIKQAAVEIGAPEDTVKHDVGRLLLRLEGLQDAAIRTALTPKTIVAALNPEAEAAALDLLRAPDLTDRIVADFAAAGMAGEASNLLALYLAATSRKLDRPLAVLIQSSSAAGKSALMDAVLALMPEDEKVRYSAMTGQSLFYLGETSLKHKILAIAEEEGVRQAAYALKLLQSDGALTIASTGKDEATGNLTTREYRVEGPVMLMLTTTAIDVDEELLNRCLVLTIDESRAQTEAIHAQQRQGETLAGLLAGATRDSILTLHRNAQSLLRPLAVVNPYADRLTFLADKTRTRRDHTKYLTLIRVIALLHQYQRPIQSVEHHGKVLSYIEVTRADILLANRIAHEFLGRTLDEVPPQTRRLLGLLRAYVEARSAAASLKPSEIRFSRRDIRAATGWGDTQLKIHLSRLAELEYVVVYRAHRGLTYEYELLYDGPAAVDGEAGETVPHLCGLIDPAILDNDADRSGQEPVPSPLGRHRVGAWSGVGRVAETEEMPGFVDDSDDLPENAHIYGDRNSPSLAAIAEAVGTAD
jgi:DNA primase